MGRGLGVNQTLLLTAVREAVRGIHVYDFAQQNNIDHNNMRRAANALIKRELVIKVTARYGTYRLWDEEKYQEFEAKRERDAATYRREAEIRDIECAKKALDSLANMAHKKLEEAVTWTTAVVTGKTAIARRAYEAPRGHGISYREFAQVNSFIKELTAAEPWRHLLSEYFHSTIVDAKALASSIDDPRVAFEKAFALIPYESVMVYLAMAKLEESLPPEIAEIWKKLPTRFGKWYSGFAGAENRDWVQFIEENPSWRSYLSEVPELLC